MRLLLDTHVLLWWRADDPRLPARWNAILGAPGDHEILFSVASLWEISIKRSLGKLELACGLEEFSAGLIRDHGFQLVPIEVAHFAAMERLARHHGDPFDRLLIAQAVVLGADAVTNDAAWKAYPVKRRW